MFRINSEADRLLRSLFQYAAKRREEGVYDLTRILSGYLNEYLNSDVVMSGRNNFAKRLREMAKVYVETDPRYQSRIDSY